MKAVTEATNGKVLFSTEKEGKYFLEETRLFNII
jgi:hypothetical protein